MRILVADVLPVEKLEELAGLGFEVVDEPKLTAETLPGAIGDASILIVRSTKVQADTIAAARGLSLIIRAGAGVNNIDVAAASSRGIYVANCPGKNSLAVAELTMGLLLSIDRRIPDNVADARAGRWNKKEFSKAQGIYGRTMGLAGFGNIGRAVAERAKAFGLQVMAWDVILTEELAAKAGVQYASALEVLLVCSDIVSLHLPATSQTNGIIDARRIGLLREGAIFINTARAELVDEPALLAAAAAGRIRVGMDVMTAEPAVKQGLFQHPAANTPGVIITHHIGASTNQAQSDTAAEAIRVVRHFRETGEVLNSVNVSRQSRAAATLIVRLVHRAGVLAGVLDVLRQAKINIQEMENALFAGGDPATAVTSLRLETIPTATTIAALNDVADVIHAELFTND